MKTLNFVEAMEILYEVPEDEVFDDYRVTERLKLADGNSMSVQASSGHYSTPRVRIDYEEYTHFEIGFPSKKYESIMSYCEDPDDPTGTVYGYVPKNLIDEIVKKAGGVIIEDES